MNSPRRVAYLGGVGLLCLLLALGWLKLWKPLHERILPHGFFDHPFESKSESKNQNDDVPSDSRSSMSDVLHSVRKPSLALREAFKILNHNPIEFYGRAVDQFGTPVGGAEVTGDVLYNTGVSSGLKRVHTVTDASGYFEFGGLEGQSFGVGVEKEGYQFNARNTLFWYSYFEADHKRHQPDRNHPVPFVLWKKRGAENLIHYSKTWRFPLSAVPVRIDLKKGELDGPDSDLIVTVSRSPLEMRYGQRGYAWNVAIEVIDGGLIRAGPLDYYNLAPDSGYQPRFEHVQEAQDLYAAQIGRAKWIWEEKVADDFFISSRQGKNFAHLVLSIWPNSDHKQGDNEALVEAEVWLNPNGSRNLEFDPAKVIPLPQR